MGILRIIRKHWLLLLVALAYGLLVFRSSIQAEQAVLAGAKTFASVILAITTAFLFVGLFQVWVKEEHIINHLGQESGLKGLFLGAGVGTVIHGPLVGVFPLLKSLLDKGARLAVIVAIASTWAIKIPMIPIELKFLGLKFTLLHQILVFASAIPMGLVMEWIIGKQLGGEK